MNELNDCTAARGLRGWWRSPPRSGMRRWIAPWEYRRLRAWAGMRIAGGIVAAGLGAFISSAADNAWAIFGALLLVVGVANFFFAAWELNIARSSPPKPEHGRT